MEPSAFTRAVDIFVRDRNGLPIPGATIAFSVEGSPQATVENAEGRGRIQLPERNLRLDVSATYAGTTQTAQLSHAQDDYTFTFDVSVGNATRDLMERHLALIVGLLLIAAAIILAFVFSAPTPLQIRIILGTFSLAGGAIATEISGMINVNLNLGTKLTIGATGALAVFVVLYLVVPS